MAGENLHRVEVRTAGVPVALACEVPTDWVRMELPQEEADFSNPTTFKPLAVWMAPYGAVVFTVAARPGYGDGTLQEWMIWLAQQQEFTVKSLMPRKVNGRWAAWCEAEQPSDVGVMGVRTALLEDGGNIITVLGMGPKAMWDAIGGTLEKMVEKVEILDPSGPTVAVVPGLPVDQGGPAKASSVSQQVEQPSVATEQTTTSNEPPAIGRHALADVPGALDPEHKINAFFRDNGRGFVPAVRELKQQVREAVVACGSLEGFVTVPFGWHVIDDSRRVLVFDEANEVQINLAVKGREGMDVPAIFDVIESDIANTYPGAKVARSEVQGVPFILFRDMNVDGTVLQQIHLLGTHPNAERVYHVRVTTPLERMEASCNLALAMLQETQFVQ